jgi:polyhydroxyalkanoate synthesis regulator phasin
MDDWQQEWWKQIEKTAIEVEKFLLSVEEVAESFVDQVSETVDVFVQQFQGELVEEVDSFVQEFIDLITAASDEVEASLWEDLEDFVDDDFIGVGSQKPTAENHPACINCANYHGRIYNGNLLVCGMHPYGWNDENCPDWEKEQ